MKRSFNVLPETCPLAQLKNLSVSFLSLVSAPATGKGLTLKTEHGQRASEFQLTLRNEDMMRAYGIVYAPDQQDAHGDTADAATIRRAATEFMREGRLKNIDTEHSFTAEMAFVAESWLVRKGDALFPDEPEGAWAVGIQIGDPDLWSALKSGELTGISLAGIAQVDPDPGPRDRYTEKDATWLAGLLKKLTGTPKDPQETEMDKGDVEKIVRETLKSELAPAIQAALAPPKEHPSDGIAEAVAKALKDAGITPKDTPAEPEQTDIQKAVSKEISALETRIGDQIAKALAKGMTETGQGTTTQESFL